MLVRALTDYADTYLVDALEDPAFEEKPVPYALQILDNGAFVGIQERVQEIVRGRGEKKKAVRVSLPLPVPKSPIARNSAVAPLLGCDAIQYVLGSLPGVWTMPGREQNHEERHTAFVRLIRRAAKETRDAALQSCAAFYAAPDQLHLARERLAMLKPKDGVLVTLSVLPCDPASEDPGGPVTVRAAVRDWWRAHYREAFADRVKRGGEGMCLVSGRIGPIAPTHDKIKGTARLGGQPAGVALMSFDKPAFTSYGWEKNANSPVSPELAMAYVTALNDLLRPGMHRRGLSHDVVVSTRHDVGDAAFLYWTRRPTDDDPLRLINDPSPRDVQELLDAPFRGQAPPDVQPNDFYLVAVSGNGGRLLVRYWFHDTLTIVKQNIRSWFGGLCIADVFHGGTSAEPPKLWQLLASISKSMGSPFERAAAVPPSRSLQLLRRALQGIPLGSTILAAALGRLRLEQGSGRLDPVRIGLIRLCVNDAVAFSSNRGPLMSESLNAALDDPAYVCGRLLAVFDNLQRAAQGNVTVNVTIVDRYFSLASTSPMVAFPKIRDLAQHHLRKLRRDHPGAAVNIGRELDRLYDRLAQQGAVFPRQFSLEDQGRFAIGFHHQKAEDARQARARKEQRAADGADVDSTPAALS